MIHLDSSFDSPFDSLSIPTIGYELALALFLLPSLSFQFSAFLLSVRNRDGGSFFFFLGFGFGFSFNTLIGTNIFILHDVEEVGVYHPTSASSSYESDDAEAEAEAKVEAEAEAESGLLNGWLQLSCGFCVYLLSSSSRMLFSSPT